MAKLSHRARAPRTGPVARVLASLLVCSALALSAPAAASTPDYKVGAGDVLSVIIYGEEDMTRSYIVDSAGGFELPHLGRVSVVGLTVDEVRAQLTEGLADGILVVPQVSVQVEAYLSRQVQVYGTPQAGNFHLAGPTRLIELLAMAGGAKAGGGASREVVVEHQDGTEQIVGLTLLMNTGEGNIEIVPGDVVRVRDAKHVYVSGQVKEPGMVVFREGITVSQVLIQSGGPAATARLRGAYVLRDGERIHVNLRRINLGKETDLVLEPDDQLVIKESVF